MGEPGGVHVCYLCVTSAAVVPWLDSHLQRSPSIHTQPNPTHLAVQPHQPTSTHTAAPLQVARLDELLANVVSDTRGRIEKKQAQTYEEMLAEQAEAEAAAAAGGGDDEEEEDEYVYNPLKLPLGWDGKPIPYWLYKLHGLNQEFKCEICGNYRCASFEGGAFWG